MNALERIVARTRVEVADRMAARPLADVRRAAESRLSSDPPRGFATALAAPGLSVIAEHKRRSPSAGAIREDLSLVEVVTAYERGGARALSVLTEAESFGGSLADLAKAHQVSGLPILRKDFMVSEYQVLEAVALGADAILLIIAVLTESELRELHACALAFGLDVLVEAYAPEEVAVAVAIGARIVGMNNRDLTTMQVDVGRSLGLCEAVPAGTVTVSESGLREPADLQRVAAAGIDAVLVGESLMRAADVEAATRSLTTPRASARLP